jgi:hypothetical protein
MWEQVRAVLGEAFERLGAVIAADLPGIVAMLIVLASTTVAAFVIRAILGAVLGRTGFDRRAREWGVTTGRDLGPRQEPSAIVSRFAFWLVVVAGIALALEVLGASTVSAFGLSLLVFLPKLVVGAIILLVGIGAARFLERSALISAVNQQIRQARLIALAVKWLVLVLAAAMALEHVGIGGELPTLAFALVVGGIVLSVALAVGLGARDAVSRALDRDTRGEPRPREPGPAGPEDKVQHL